MLEYLQESYTRNVNMPWMYTKINCMHGGKSEFNKKKK